jgi:hypothetical protein
MLDATRQLRDRPTPPLLMANHCSFVLLAEFHIQEGAQLKYQFPQPLGVDERYIITLTGFSTDSTAF